MTVAILVELAIAFAGGLAFVLLYGWRWTWLRSPMGRHMMAFSVVMTGEAGALLAAGLGVQVPLWLFVVGFGLVDAVVLHRLWLLVWARRHPT